MGISDMETCPPENKKERSDVFQDKGNPAAGRRTGAESFRRTGFCIRRILRHPCSGTLTLEAAVSVPLFLLAFLVLTGLMDVYRIQAEVKASISQSARELGMYAYAWEYLQESPAGVLSSAACAAYGQNALPDLGEGVQISLLRSSYQEDSIHLVADIFYRLPVSFGPITAIHLENQARVGVWTGADPDRYLDLSEKKKTGMVYITEHESVYHTSSSCTHIRLSVHAGMLEQVKSLKNDYGESYQPCARCGNHSSGETVYYSDKGTCYHRDAGCGGLKRKVRLVKLEEVEGKQICSRCGT